MSLLLLGGGPGVDAGTGPAEIIVNSGFLGDGSPWTAVDLGGGTSVGAGQGTLNDPDDNGEEILQDISDGSAGTYHLTYTVTSRTSGSIKPTVNSVAGVSRTTTGSFSEDIIVPSPTGSPLIKFAAGSAGVPVLISFTNVHLTRTA